MSPKSTAVFKRKKVGKQDLLDTCTNTHAPNWALALLSERLYLWSFSFLNNVTNTMNFLNVVVYNGNFNHTRKKK